MIRHINNISKEVVTIKYNENHILDFIEIETSDKIIFIDSRFKEDEIRDFVINEFSGLIEKYDIEDLSLMMLEITYRKIRLFFEFGYFLDSITDLLYDLEIYPKQDDVETSKLQTKEGFQNQLTQLFQITGRIFQELELEEEVSEVDCLLCELKSFLSYMSSNATEEEKEYLTDLCTEVVCEIDSEEYTFDLPLIEVFEDLNDVISYLDGDQLIDAGDVILSK
jgi:hypothetical protein